MIDKENTTDKEKFIDDPFDSYDIPFDYEFDEDEEELNRIYNIQNPFDYENIDDFEEKIED